MPSQILAGALLASLGLILLQGCGPGNTNSGAPAQRSVDQIVLRTRVTLKDEDVAKLPADFIEKATSAGWKRVAGGFEKMGPGPGIKVTNGQQTVTTDAEGRFSLPGSLGNLKLIADEDKNVMVPLTEAVSARSERQSANVSEGPEPGAGAWVLTIPSKLGSSAATAPCCQEDALCEKPIGRTTLSGAVRPSGEPMEGRCLDYNGWWSDGGNYGKTDWRAYRNFVMSDCDRAFFNGCWRDHYSGSCWNVHGQGGCSKVIGHSADYHKHNFPR